MNMHARSWRIAARAALAAAAVLVAAAGCQPTADRQLTIVLVEYQGPDAAASAQRVARELSSQNLPNVFVVEGADHASVCVGRYNSWKDPEADAMLRRVRQIRDARGQYPFSGVLLMPIPEERPENRWPLEKAKGLFTLHVASWEAPGRAVAARAYAADLRSRGYEAYVYDGPRLSMVTVGAFGLNIFDAPSKVGRPGMKPKIVSPAVLDLIQKFPRMRLEGQETPPEAHVPTQLVSVPGREPPVGPAVAAPRALYRVSLALVDARTGMAEGRSRASGIAQSREEFQALLTALVKQVADTLPPGKALRVGVAGVLAADAEAAKSGADAAVLEALVSALRRAAAGKISVVDPTGTRQVLDAAGLKPADVLREPRAAKGLAGLDYVLTATVTVFPV